MLRQSLLPLFILSVYMFGASNGWKAINWNQARFAMRTGGYNYMDAQPRNYQHSIYRFGYCAKENLVRKYLKKKILMKISSQKSHHDSRDYFIYLLAQKNTINQKLQCVVMKIFTNIIFRLVNSQLPMYYCQGVVHYVMMNTIQRLELHEFYFKIFIALSESLIKDFTECHDDFAHKPPDGILQPHSFTWLGVVNYVHVTTDLPHHYKSPRVVLVHKHFAMGTSMDLLRVPKNYKLGNIVFGDYERDEEDCALTKTQIHMGLRCPGAYIEIPFTDVIPHPEFSRFGVGNSLALVKLLRPLKSLYTVPVCLPTYEERQRKKRTKVVFLIDYISAVPKDFTVEKMAKKSLKLYTHRDCKRHRMRSRLGSEGVSHVLCSSGCGVRTGAPIITHSTVGNFELIGLAAGSAPCSRRSQRHRLNTQPPIYIDVYPFTSWIINTVTAHILPLPYPNKVKLTDAGVKGGYAKGFLRKRKKVDEGWKGHNYVCGDWCYRSERKKNKLAFFYSEKFEVNADPPAMLNIFLQLSAGLETTILCVNILFPNRMVTPKILGVGGYNVSVAFSTNWFPFNFFYTVGVYGRNTTYTDMEEWHLERNERFW